MAEKRTNFSQKMAVVGRCLCTNDGQVSPRHYHQAKEDKLLQQLQDVCEEAETKKEEKEAITSAPRLSLDSQARTAKRSASVSDHHPSSALIYVCYTGLIFSS